MSIFELLILAVGLAMDAFAISISTGLSAPRGASAATAGARVGSRLRSPKETPFAVNQRSLKISWKEAAVCGLYFGVAQAVMPLIGYFIGARFADLIAAFSYWVVFAILCFIGGKMIVDTLRGETGGSGAKFENLIGFRRMFPLAIATSIDALAVGFGFSLLSVPIFSAALIIGSVTFVVSAIGAFIGQLAGAKFDDKARIIGGAILIIIGVRVLVEGLLA